MASVNENKTTGTFPFDSLHLLRPTAPLNSENSSRYTTQSYDNRSRISDIAAGLKSKLGYMETRISSSSFLSESFSWQVKTATSSDSDRLLGKADSTALEKDYSIEIDSIANPRTANSDRLASDDASGFETGTYSYSLTVGSTTYSISLAIENKIGDPATNKDVFLGIERSINRLGLDVTAELKEVQARDYNPYRENSYENMSYLTISSNSTGDGTSFILADTSGSMIEDLGLDSVNSFGYENRYRLNGTQTSSDSNQIVVNTGTVDGILLGTTGTGENLKIRVEDGRDKLTDELSSIIGDYNELIAWIDDYDYVISKGLKTTLFKEMSSVLLQNQSIALSSTGVRRNAASVTGFSTELNIENKETIDSALQDIGLNLKNDGTLEITNDFANKVNSDLRKVHETLAGDDGFFTKIADAIDSIQAKKESSYVFSLNSMASYNQGAKSHQSIYRGNSSSIINYFA